MQDEDDERQDLERALYARPTGDDRDEALRAEALRVEAQRIEAQRAEALQAEAQRRLPTAAAPEAQPGPRGAGPARTAGEPSPAAPPARSRLVLLGAGLLVGGLVVGAATASVIGAATPDPVSTTASPTPTPDAADRFAALVEGWAATTDVPPGLSLISGGAEVYSPTFETAQDDRLLLTAPDATRICLALERPDGSLSAGCTGLEAFFAGDALDVVGTATGTDTPVYTRVTLRPDGSVEGGFQLVATPGPEA
ncbi:MULTISPECIES: hypothetical protein [unclassified Rathayibacter]|uniref:hypothetical protein n=1 Tax=unclassified Rathayibacter TaxID=2609250 RepID=UPI001046BBA6|nr:MULTISPECIES: hypothetical protein [unclassified Rathayibacter]TCL85925.1 hypothetical protein EDF49_101594 [Rathayibacter sp. PhB192]TCM31746.1 hypothetical protein EDF43_101594 [Rathayibacter sp. PhB179]